MNTTFEERRPLGRPRNRWKVDFKEHANQLLGITDWRIMTDRRIGSLEKSGLDLDCGALFID